MLDSVNLEDVMIGGSSAGRKELVEQPGWGPIGFRSGDWKLISPKKGAPKLFNLADDPGEKNDLAAKNPQLASSLQERLRVILKER
jgi:arylsulfatase A-like enzyme